MIRSTPRPSISLLFLVALSAPVFGFGQDSLPAPLVGGPLTGPPVLDAPFSAEATTTVKVHRRGGGTIDQRTTMRFFRDRAGRVRIEQRMEGLPPARTASERAIRTVIDPDPDDESVYLVDEVTRTARRVSRSIVALTAGGGWSFAIPVGGVRFLDFRRALDPSTVDVPGGRPATTESLGSRWIEGLETIGRRGTISVDGITVIDERWESPELRLVIRARSTDSRTGVVHYALGTIERREQPAGLFELPPDAIILRGTTPDDPWVEFGGP